MIFRIPAAKSQTKTKNTETAKKTLAFLHFACYNHLCLGGIAQLGERMTGSHEVSGSIPLISTNNRPQGQRLAVLFYPEAQIHLPTTKQVRKAPIFIE